MLQDCPNIKISASHAACILPDQCEIASSGPKDGYGKYYFMHILRTPFYALYDRLDDNIVLR